jgi:hypothetical protein
MLMIRHGERTKMKHKLHRGGAEARRKTEQPQIFADERRSKKLKLPSISVLICVDQRQMSFLFSASPRLRGEPIS